MINNLEKALIQVGIETVEIADVVKAVPARVQDIIQSFEADELSRLLNDLVYIHVTRNTYLGRGVLLENCKDSASVDLLWQLGLVDKEQWGSKIKHTVVRDTTIGRKISEIVLRAKIRALNFNEIRSTFHPITFWICRDIVVKSKKYTLPTTFPNSDPFVQPDEPVSQRLLNTNAFIFNKFKDFADKLVDAGVVELANGFNSNNIWEKEYVFPEETDAFLEPLIKSFDPQIVTKIESLLKAMDHKYRAIDFLYRYDPQAYQGLGNYRQAANEIIFYLRNLGSSVKVVPETFSKGFREAVPFIIWDRNSYENALNDFKKNLVGEMNAKIDEIIEGLKKTGFIVTKGKTKEEKAAVAVEEGKEKAEELNITTLGEEVIVGAKERHEQEGVLGRIGNANVVLDFYEPHAITILGVQGSGKSYATGVIIEMALKEILGLSKMKQPLSCIIFHFSKEEKRRPEWIGLVEANNDPAQNELLKRYGALPSSILSDNINIFVPPKVLNKRKEEYPNLRVIPLSFSPSKLKAEDWRRLLTFGMGSDALYLELIKDIMIDLRDVRPEFGAEDLIEVIEQSKDLNKGQRKLAKVRIKTIGRWLDEKAASLDEYLKPGVVNVVDFRDPLSVDEKMAAVLLQTLFSLIKDRPSNEICLVCIDEAHLFLRNEALTGDIVEFVKLLRKDYRVYLLLISQHPKDFHPDILGLSDIILCHRLDDGKELNFLKEHQSKFSSVTERIKKLNTKEGEAYIWARVSTNSVLNNPQLIRIRPKVTKDKGRTATAF